MSRLKNVHAQCIERNGRGRWIFLHRIVPGGGGSQLRDSGGRAGRAAERSDHKSQTVVGQLENGTPAPSNTGASPDSSGQLSLFDPLEIQPAARETAASSLTSEEQEVLEAVRKWDLMNKTPFECMQFLHKIKQKLN